MNAIQAAMNQIKDPSYWPSAICYHDRYIIMFKCIGRFMHNEPAQIFLARKKAERYCPKGMKVHCAMFGWNGNDFIQDKCTLQIIFK